MVEYEVVHAFARTKIAENTLKNAVVLIDIYLSIISLFQALKSC